MGAGAGFDRADRDELPADETSASLEDVVIANVDVSQLPTRFAYARCASTALHRPPGAETAYLCTVSGSQLSASCPAAAARGETSTSKRESAHWAGSEDTLPQEPTTPPPPLPPVQVRGGRPDATRRDAGCGRFRPRSTDDSDRDLLNTRSKEEALTPLHSIFKSELNN